MSNNNIISSDKRQLKNDYCWWQNLMTNIKPYNMCSRLYPCKISLNLTIYSIFCREGSPSPVTYFEEPTCPGTCTSGLGSSPMFFYGSNKSPLTSGSQIAFFNGPKNSYPNWRYFGFRAIVWSGKQHMH